MSDPRELPGSSSTATGGGTQCSESAAEQHVPVESPFSACSGPGIESHPTGGGRDTSHGQTYAVKMVMLWLYRLSTVEQDFCISIEDSRADKFDDFHLQLKQDDGSWLQYFVQLKHADNNDILLLKELLPPPNQKTKSSFDLRMYFNSFLTVENCPDFQLPGQKKYILYTNKNFKYGQSKGNFKITPDIFETVDDNHIFGTKFLKFKTKFPGREVLVEELSKNLPENVDNLEKVETFLDHFYLAVDQHHVSELEKIIKDELQVEFKSETENAFSVIHKNITDWFLPKGPKTGTRIHREPLQKYFQNIKRPIENKNFHCMDPIPTFYGREDCVEKIFKSLTDAKSDTPPKIDIVISGMGGMGKSELARFYAKKYHENYDHTIWLNSDTEQNLAQNFIELYTFLGLRENPKSPLTLDEKIRTIYTSLEKKRCLLIFDNAENDESSEKNYEVLRRFIPESKSIKHDIIFTSQFMDWDDCGLQIPLETFTETESLKFLEKNLKSNFYLEKSELAELSQILGNFPLALQNAVKLLISENKKHKKLGKSGNSNSSIVRQFIEKFQEENEYCEKFLLTEYKSGMHSPYTKTIMRLVELGVDGIWTSEFEHRNEAMKLYFSLAYLQPDNISVDLLLHHPLVSSKDQLDEILLFLDNRSLIKAQDGIISIHRLYQNSLVTLLSYEHIENNHCHAKIKEILSKHKMNSEDFIYHWKLQYSSIRHESYENFCISEKQGQEIFFPFMQDNVNFESLLPKNEDTKEIVSKIEEIPENNGIIPGKLALELTRVMVEISAMHSPSSGFNQHYMHILNHAQKMQVVDKNYITHTIYFFMSNTIGLGTREMFEQFLIFADPICIDLFTEHSLEYHIFILMILLVRREFETYTNIFENGRLVGFEDEIFDKYFPKCKEYAHKLEPQNNMLNLLLQNFNKKQFIFLKENEKRKKDPPYSIETILNNTPYDEETVYKFLCLPVRMNDLIRDILEECMKKSPKNTIIFLQNLQPDFMRFCENDSHSKCICSDIIFILCTWYLSQSIYCKTEQSLLKSIEHERKLKLSWYDCYLKLCNFLYILYNEINSKDMAFEKCSQIIEKDITNTKRSLKLHSSYAEILERNCDFSSAKNEYIKTFKCMLICHKNITDQLKSRGTKVSESERILIVNSEISPENLNSCLYKILKMYYLETKNYHQCFQLLDELLVEYKKYIGIEYQQNQIHLIQALILEEAQVFDQANLAWIKLLQYLESIQIPFHKSYQDLKFIWIKISKRFETLSENLLQKIESVILNLTKEVCKPKDSSVFHMFQNVTFLAIKIFMSLKKFHIVFEILNNFENYEFSIVSDIQFLQNLKPRLAQYRAELTYKSEDMGKVELELKSFLEEHEKKFMLAKLRYNKNMNIIEFVKEYLALKKLNFYSLKKSIIQIHLKNGQIQEALLEIDNLLKYYKTYLEMESNFIQEKLKLYILKKIELLCQLKKFEEAINFWKENKKLFTKCENGETEFDSNYCETFIDLIKDLIKSNEWELTQKCIEIWEKENIDENNLDFMQQCIVFYEKIDNFTKSREIFENYCHILTECHLDETNINYEKSAQNLKIKIYNITILQQWKKGKYSSIYYPEKRIYELEILFCIVFCFYKFNEKTEALIYVEKIEKFLEYKKKDCAELENISENVKRLKSLSLALPGEASSEKGVTFQGLVPTEGASSSLVPHKSPCGYTKCRCHMMSSELVESESDESGSELVEEEDEEDEWEDEENNVESEFKDSEDEFSESDISILTDLDDLDLEIYDLQD